MLGHPKSLFMLSFTEMWERFSYYGMRAILVLYMVAKVQDAGLDWGSEKALKTYGLYTGMVWLTPLLGGFLADRYLGQRLAIFIGSVIIAAGHFLLAVNGITTFVAGLCCICLGTGFFKPCVTSILGGLYEGKDASRDSAYSIFYMCINIGSVLGSFLTGWLQVRYNFHYGFAAAGFGMIASIVIFMFSQKYLKDVGRRPVREAKAVEQTPKIPLNTWEKRRVTFIFFLALLTVLYFMAFEQAGGLLTLYAQDHTDRFLKGWEMPASWFQILNPAFVVAFAPLMSLLWVYLGKIGKDPSILVKVAFGFLITGVAFLLLIPPTAELANHVGAKVSMGWLIAFYAIYTVAELLVIPLIWSTVSKLAPKRYLSLLMAVVLGSIGVGSYLAGYVGSYVERLGPNQIFVGLTLTMFTFGVICLLANRSLMRLAEGAGEEQLARVEATV